MSLDQAEITAKDIWERLKALAAQMRGLAEPPLPSLGSWQADIFGGVLDADLIIPDNRALIWTTAGVEVARWEYDNSLGTDAVKTGGFIVLEPPAYLVWATAGVVSGVVYTSAAGDLRLYAPAGGRHVYLYSTSGNLNLNAVAGKIMVNDDTYISIDFLKDVYDRQTVAQVQALILAECAAGEDIDNAIDALIAAGVVGGGVIDNAIDALVLAHKGGANEHHAQLHEAAHRLGGADALNHDNLAGFVANEHLLQGAMSLANLGTRVLANLSDVTLTGALLEDGEMYGAANHDYVPCVPVYAGNRPFNMGVFTLLPTTTGTVYFYYMLPLPLVKNGLGLRIDGWKIGIDDADAAAYVDETLVYTMNYFSQTIINTDLTNLDDILAYTHAFAAVNVSAQDVVFVRLKCVTDVAAELDVSYVKLRCYYA